MVKSTKVAEHVVKGEDHGFGLYSEAPALSTETINTTVDFLAEQLE